MPNEGVIVNLYEQILDHCNPKKIILFSKKYNISGELSSFKLCVIVSDDININSLKQTLYLELECENPFDVLIYRQSEWDENCEDEHSFAEKIKKSGAVLYEL